MPTMNKVDLLDCAAGHHNFSDDSSECHVCGHSEEPPPQPATIWLISAEHWYVPGFIQKAFTSRALADEEAADLVRIMQKDAEMPADATAADWSTKFEEMKATLANQEAGDCYVEVSELPLIDGRA